MARTGGPDADGSARRREHQIAAGGDAAMDGDAVVEIQAEIAIGHDLRAIGQMQGLPGHLQRELLAEAEAALGDAVGIGQIQIAAGCRDIRLPARLDHGMRAEADRTADAQEQILAAHPGLRAGARAAVDQRAGFDGEQAVAADQAVIGERAGDREIHLRRDDAPGARAGEGARRDMEGAVGADLAAIGQRAADREGEVGRGGCALLRHGTQGTALIEGAADLADEEFRRRDLAGARGIARDREIDVGREDLAIGPEAEAAQIEGDHVPRPQAARTARMPAGGEAQEAIGDDRPVNAEIAARREGEAGAVEHRVGGVDDITPADREACIADQDTGIGGIARKREAGAAGGIDHAIGAARHAAGGDGEIAVDEDGAAVVEGLAEREAQPRRIEDTARRVDQAARGNGGAGAALDQPVIDDVARHDQRKGIAQIGTARGIDEGAAD